MSRMPDYDYCALAWATFYPRDWLADTRDVGTAERGLYIDVLSAIYSAGGPIEYGKDYLCRLGGYKNVRSLSRELGPLLKKKKLRVLKAGDGSEWLMNGRAEEEIEKARQRRDKKEGERKPFTDMGDEPGHKDVGKNGDGKKSGKKPKKKPAKTAKKSAEHSDNTMQKQAVSQDISQPQPQTDSTVLPLQGKDSKSPSPPRAAALPDGAPLTAEQMNLSRTWLWEQVVACLRNGAPPFVLQGEEVHTVPAVAEAELNAWVAPMRLQRIETGAWHVGAPTRLMRDHAEKHFGEAIVAAINNIMMFHRPRDAKGSVMGDWSLKLHVGV